MEVKAPAANPIARLLECAEMLRELAPEHAAWLEAGAHAHARGNEEIGRALGFTTGALGRSPRFEYLRAQRNALLAEALDEADGDADFLGLAISDYLVRVPSWQRAAADPDPKWGRVRQLIHAADRLGLGLPQTAKGLAKTLAPGTEG